jgi:hypothetical protein
LSLKFPIPEDNYKSRWLPRDLPSPKFGLNRMYSASGFLCNKRSNISEILNLQEKAHICGDNDWNPPFAADQGSCGKDDQSAPFFSFPSLRDFKASLFVRFMMQSESSIVVSRNRDAKRENALVAIEDKSFLP